MLTIIAANIDNKKKNIANHSSSVNLLSDVNRFAIKSMPDSINISFAGDVPTNIFNVDQAKNISGIHCPVCGVKMFTENEYKNLLQESETISTPKELANLLLAYKDYVPSNMRKMLEDIDNTANSSNTDMHDFYFKLRSVANNRFHKRVFYASSKLKGFAEPLRDEVKSDVLTAADKMLKVKSYNDFKNIFVELYQNPNLTQSEKNSYTRNILHDVKSAGIFLGVFSFPASQMTPNELAKTLITRIFSKSLIESSTIQNNDCFGDLRNNSVLLCSKCHRNKPEHTFVDFKNIKVQSLPYIKDNFNTYLSDIAALMGKRELDYDPMYFNDFCFYVNKLSGSRIVFDEVALTRLKNLRYLSTRRDRFEPAEQTEVDIPCAGCGSIMLPHANRRLIRHDLQNSKTPKEYLDVLNKYNKYIGAYSIDLYKIFKLIVEQNPTITIEEFLPLFEHKVNKLSDVQIDNALLEFERNKEYFLKNGTPEQKEYLLKFDSQLYSTLESGRFSDYKFIDIFESITSGIDLNAYKMPKAIYVLLDDFRKIAHINSISRYSELDAKCDKDPVETIAFNMFKSDVFTIDHLVSMAKGGSRTKDNLIGLCKFCNTLKSEKGVRAWYVENFEVRKNFHKHLLVIDDMAKKGLISDFDTWARDVAEKMYELTYGKYDIRHLFKNDK